MSEDKNLGILKVAKELNIGLGTIAEFLNGQGFKVEARPNTKLTGDMYNALLKEYQGDKNLKEEAKSIVIGKIRRDDANTVIDETPISTPSSKNKNEDEGEEILIKNVGSAPSINIETKKEETKPAEAVEAAPSSPGVKVVGKIDLDSLNSKTRPDKKSFNEVPEQVVKPEVKEKPEEAVHEDKPIIETQPEPVAEAPKKEEPKVEEEKAVENKEEKVEEVPVSETKPKTDTTVTENTDTKAAAEEETDDVIRAKAKQLTGPKVIGRIELPINKKKDQPVASSSNPNTADNKRKRKRKPAAGGSQGGGSNHPQGQGAPQQGNRPPQAGNGQNNQNRTAAPGARPPHRRGQPVPPKAEPTEKEIQDQIKATLARLSGAGKSGKFAQRSKLRRQKRDDVAATTEERLAAEQMDSKVLKTTEFVTANELATMMDVTVTEIIATCMSLGLFVSINQRLDAETLTIVADEFGYEIQFVGAEDEEVNLEEEDAEEDLLPRSPIVTVMGHVDHGKTSLLDFIRKANVISGEAGGITQHIGAYEVKLDEEKSITFLDTPGHEAFTAMRARGAKVTDVAIIVIAADDTVMPQTTEAINHALAANLPMVFAFNKMDKPGANPDKIREQLSAMNILVEEWGGKYQTQEISAKSGMNIDKLLEKVSLEAELLELKANPNKRAVGTVIEAQLDKGRGYVATVLVEAGTLKVGDPILAGSYSGRVKALYNERGSRVEKAGPAAPVQVLGFQGAPQAGDRFNGVESEPEAREIANKRLQLQREQGLRTQKHITLDEIGRRLAIGNFKELNIIIKGDVDGSVEALSDSLQKLSTEQIQVKIVHKAVGPISESDVLLATASDAIIIGFQVRPSAGARKLAEAEEIDVRLYSIIYKAIDEIKAAMEGMLAPEFEEKIVANVEIRETFKITKVGTIAGCMVLDGTINRNSKIRIIREGVVVYTGELESLKRFKDDVKEVSRGYECGLNIKGYNDIQVGDIVEAYEQVEVKRKL
ncbi:translation initiation factor IF-2 [Pedobacter sp. SD-b]|uniref:Translation initiation factor IF-2 n=1 Tax=Pedobacter segetis TaxID=2793069 RepID=A0ABS1BFD4_9SPHI|nr:translation initiation factor IF-2 [Pedobacter segetis]MBK0381516.1 translation initiation factor IF-2 [Pedobacter segetis]